MRKITSLFLALMMLLGSLATVTITASAAESGTCGDDLTWTYDDVTATLTVSGTGEMENHPDFGSIRDNVRYIVIERGVAGIGEYAFEHCISLERVTLPDTLKSIGEGAFDSCSLKSITLPGGLTKLGFDVFFNSELESITLPASFTLDAAEMLYDCKKLSAVNVETGNEKYCSVDGVLYSKDKTALLYWPNAKGTVCNVPDGVKTIGNFAFSCCPGLEEINLNAVEEIGIKAFCECANLTGIDLAGVKTIGEFAFFHCTGLSGTLILPDRLTAVDTRAFELCTGLNAVSIGSDLSSLGNLTFFGCSGLESITVAAENMALSSSNGVLFNKEKTRLLQYPSAREGTSYTVPDGVTTIETSAFSECKSLTSITIPDSVTYIDYIAFSNCTSLKNIRIPSTVLHIDGNAFVGSPVTISCCPDSPASKVLYSGDGITVAETHDFSDIWSFNDSSHWHACSCGAKKDEGDHIDDIHDGKCDICLKDQTNINHSFKGEWQKDAEGHWQVCSCGATNKTAHTAKAVEENVVDATYTSVRTWTEVVYCSECGYEISRTQKSGGKLTPDALADNLGTKSAAYKTNVSVTISINNIPDGAKVYIDDKEATVSGNTYSANLGQLTSDKTCKVEIKLDGTVIEESSLKVEVGSGFFAKIASFFSNFLFNGFKWKETTVKF